MIHSELGRDIVIIACAVSAGIHAALVPHHLQVSAAGGGGFIAATAVLAILIVALTLAPRSVAVPALAATVLVFAGLLASYALAVTSGVPFLHPEAEPVDALALATKAVEGIGLAAALDLIRLGRKAHPMTTSIPGRPIPLALTTLIALFSALAASGAHDASAHEATAHRQAVVSSRELALHAAQVSGAQSSA